jgi:hypothetical protein
MWFALLPAPSCVSVMVLKKLGDELAAEMVEAVRYLGEQKGLTVLVEDHEYQALGGAALPWLRTFTNSDQER